jgi:hypothetical protein
MLDLPEHSVLVGGLEDWRGAGPEVHESRLAAKLSMLLGGTPITMRMPPAAQESTTTGIRVWQFPEWFVTQDLDVDEAGGRSRLLLHRRHLTRGKYLDRNRKRQPVVPIRFVRACRRGHIGDIDWLRFVHRGTGDCPHRRLYLDERGMSGDLGEVWIRCQCGSERPMNDATVLAMHPLEYCDGSRPWLGPNTREECQEPNRLLIRTASNAYFAQTLNVISLPEADGRLVQAVDAVWENHLQYVGSLDELRRERVRTQVKNALEGFSDEEILSAIESRRSGASPSQVKPVKLAEMEVLSASLEETGHDEPDGDFYARSLQVSGWDHMFARRVERVVLVHRLREVIAEVGFTRFEPAAPDTQGDLDLNVQRAALSIETQWLPAVENRGEGIFVQFRREEILQWMKRREVIERGRRLLSGFDAWRADHAGTRREFPGVAYVMLHTLSHLLLTSIALECGYPASSLKERVYASDAGFGILLYTATSDAEGTLGGLVQEGRRMQHHLLQALDLGRLCSNDPVCAQHDSSDDNERRFLAGAACHGCVLIAETSCEMYNDFLDRSLVVPTVGGEGAEFFHDE